LGDWDADARLKVGMLREENLLAAFGNADADAEPGVRLWWEYLECVGYSAEVYGWCARAVDREAEGRKGRRMSDYAAKVAKGKTRVFTAAAAAVAAAEAAERVEGRARGAERLPLPTGEGIATVGRDERAPAASNGNAGPTLPSTLARTPGADRTPQTHGRLAPATS
ncbi:hypothetical protein LTR53_019040, partial [Teratosphaeriaceae sp. CCFEE 6253]